MPTRLVEFASRYEGRIVEKSLGILNRIKRVPVVPQKAEYFDVNAEIDRAVSYLDKNNPKKAAIELQELATRLEEKLKVAQANLAATQHETAAVQLFLGALSQRIPERAQQSLPALRRAATLRPADPEAHKEIGLLERDAADYPAARKSFEKYWQAASALDGLKRRDKNLLIIDSHRLTADCHRLEGSPDLEKDELKMALDVADTITDGSMKPPSLKAKILEDLGVNAHNRKSPQTDKIEEYIDKSAAEFVLIGMSNEAERVRNKKKEMTIRSAA
jgi:hypothetical protein